MAGPGAGWSPREEVPGPGGLRQRGWHRGADGRAARRPRAGCWAVLAAAGRGCSRAALRRLRPRPGRRRGGGLRAGALAASRSEPAKRTRRKAPPCRGWPQCFGARRAMSSRPAATSLPLRPPLTQAGYPPPPAPFAAGNLAPRGKGGDRRGMGWDAMERDGPPRTAGSVP